MPGVVVRAPRGSIARARAGGPRGMLGVVVSPGRSGGPARTWDGVGGEALLTAQRGRAAFHHAGSRGSCRVPGNVPGP